MSVYYITRTSIDRINHEIDLMIEACVRYDQFLLKYVSDGWLKPYKWSVISNTKRNSIIPKARKRESKQIFLLKAA